MPQPNRFVYTGIFFTCGCLLISELLLTRVFAVCLWYHFAFFVISIAMFGLGLGGLFIQIKKGLFNERTVYIKLFYFALLMAVTSLFAPAILFKTNIPQSIFRTFDLNTALFLGAAFLISSFPFFFGGLITSIVFSHFSKHISKLYFADLGGAAAGCFLTVPLIQFFGAPAALLINAVFGCFAAFFFLFGEKPSARHLARGAAVIFILLSVVWLNHSCHLFEVRYAKGRNLTTDDFFKWDSISRIGVTKIKDRKYVGWEARTYWGVSKNYHGDYAPARFIHINADAGTFLTSFDGDFNKVRWIQYDPPSLVHRLKKGAQVLVIGCGGGKDVLTALSFGASHVTGVDLNPIIIKDVMLKRYSGFNVTYHDPRVTVFADEGRNFVASRKAKYDIIQLSYVDTSIASSGGAYILAENNLYTKDSFKDFLKHLKPGGIFSVCWVDVPGLAGGTRLVSLGIKALEELGIKDAGRHMMVVTNADAPFWIIKNVMLKLTPFTPQEQQTIIDAARQLGFEATYIPEQDAGHVDLGQVHGMKDLIRALINNPADRETIYQRYPLNLRTTTDDSPFFYYQGHPGEFFKVYTNGSGVLVGILFIGIVMVTFFYFAPMVFLKKLQFTPFLFYFSSIGMGFMLLEIFFLQRLLLFLGHPIYTLSTTLFTILLFAGLGSLYTNRLTSQEPRFYIYRAILAVVLIALAYFYILSPIFQFFMGYPKFIKIPVAVLTLMPLSFFMGMPLPLAVRILHQKSPDIIPWMWGVNGATSVLASIIAIILAMNIGYHFVLCSGIIFYLLAFLSARKC